MIPLSEIFDNYVIPPKTKPCIVDDCAIGDNIKAGLQLNGWVNAKPWMRNNEHTGILLVEHFQAIADKNYDRSNKLLDYVEFLNISAQHWCFLRGLFHAGGVDAIRKFFKIN